MRLKFYGKPETRAKVVYGVARVLLGSVRLRVEGYERFEDWPKPLIFCGWHGRTMLAAKHFRGKGVWTIVSLSRDGQMQAGIFERFGFQLLRGSSGREKGGMRALIGAIRVLKPGERMAFPPDGPQGPSGVVQPGVMMMARKTGASVVPVGVSASRRWLVNAWDRYLVPKPFSKGLMLFGDPIELSADATDEELQTACDRLAEEMKALEERAEREMGHDPPFCAPHPPRKRK